MKIFAIFLGLILFTNSCQLIDGCGCDMPDDRTISLKIYDELGHELLGSEILEGDIEVTYWDDEEIRPPYYVFDDLTRNHRFTQLQDSTFALDIYANLIRSDDWSRTFIKLRDDVDTIDVRYESSSGRDPRFTASEVRYNGVLHEFEWHSTYGRMIEVIKN